MRCNHKNFIKRLQRQKEDALEFVVDEYLPMVKGVVYKVLLPLKNEGLIDECINDVFLSVWDNATKFQGETVDFKKWIGAIAKFKAIDYYRKTAKKVEISIDMMDVRAEYSVEEELIVMEDRKDLIKLLNELEPVDREIFMMKYFLGAKTEEIAVKLGLTNASVHNRLYRGKKKLHQEAKKQHLEVM